MCVSQSKSSFSSRSERLTSDLSPVARILNVGALLIAQNRYAEGIEASQQVILQVKGLLEQEQQQQGHSPSLRVAPLYHDDNANSTSLFLYPFLVETRPSSAKALFAVAFFNMAVAHSASSQSSTEQVKACYQYAVDLLDDSLLVDPEGSLIYVYLALCRNISSTSASDATRDEWDQALNQAFLTIPPYPDCPVYRHFERTAN